MRVVVRTRLVWLLAMLTLASVLAAAPTDVAAQSPAEDTLSLFDDTDLASNVAVSLAIADATFDTSYRVLISRDDGFADALASGYMQTDAPLILVPTTGPLPPDVVDKIAELGAEEATILGGAEAVSETVASELRGMGLEVGRREGPSRLETAVTIAQAEAPTAETIILARAYPRQGSDDPTQAFADSLATGGMAARIQAPILLTQSEVLSRSTAEYLESNSDVQRVLLMGGTAAISDETEQAIRDIGIDVDRIAGPGRADTAIEIAKTLGDTSADSTARVIAADSVDPNSWAAGFALAGHAARFDAPIVLLSGNEIPPATADFLRTGIAGDPVDAPVLTCATSEEGCDSVRVAAQLEEAELPEFADIGPVPFNLTDGELSVLPFEGEAGQRVSIGYDRLVSTDGSPSCVDVGLYAPNDELLRLNEPENCTDVRTSSGTDRSFTLPEDGTYELRMRASRGSLTGRAFVTGLRQRPLIIDAGSPSVAVQLPGEIVHMVFYGRAGQLVSFGYQDLSSDNMDPACLELEVFGPNRRLLDELDDPQLNCSDSRTRDGSLDPIRLPVTGQYILEASFANGVSGSADLLVTSVLSDGIELGPEPTPLDFNRTGLVIQTSFIIVENVEVRFGYNDLSSATSDVVCIEHQLFAPDRTLIAEFNDPLSNCSDAEASAISTFPIIRTETSGIHFMETSIREGGSGTVSVFVQCSGQRPDCTFG